MGGFRVLPRRWVVERTFGWMIRRRRLVRGCERLLDVSEAMIRAAMGALLPRRVAHPRLSNSLRAIMDAPRRHVEPAVMRPIIDAMGRETDPHC